MFANFTDYRYHVLSKLVSAAFVSSTENVENREY